MAQERPNRLAEWIIVIREQAPVLKERFRNWIDECRAEPATVWQTPAVRYVAYATGALLGLWALSTAFTLFAPPMPKSARPEAVTADYHAVCTDADCGRHFVIHRKFGFSRFPVECPSCRKNSGARALRCNSKECSGRWVAPIIEDERRYCPLCDAPLGVDE